VHVFVTGATGLIGARLCAALVADGHRVSGLSRRAAPPEPAGVEWLLGDPCHTEDWSEVAAAADAVVHLAGASIADGRWTEARKAELVRSRVESTRVLVEALAKGSGERRSFVCASAVGYYGEGGERELDEDAPPGDDFLARLCVDWEQHATRAGALGVRVVRLRLAPVLSAEGGVLERMLPIFRTGLGGPIGAPSRWFPWIHEDDVLGLLRFCLEGPVAGPVNAAAPGAVRMGEFARTLGRVLRRPALLPVPITPLKLALGEFAEHISPHQHVVPRRAIEAGYEFVHPELEGALRACLGRD